MHSVSAWVIALVRIPNSTLGSSANFFHHGGLSRTGLMVYHPTSAPYRRRRRASKGRCPPLLFGIATSRSGLGP
jgi:hypothetical protein